jgi:hypothetical protein
VDLCHAYTLADCDDSSELHDESVDQSVCRYGTRALAHTHTQSYSDNMALLITGKFPSTTVSETMQTVMYIVMVLPVLFAK